MLFFSVFVSPWQQWDEHYYPDTSTHRSTLPLLATPVILHRQCTIAFYPGVKYFMHCICNQRKICYAVINNCMVRNIDMEFNLTILIPTIKLTFVDLTLYISKLLSFVKLKILIYIFIKRIWKLTDQFCFISGHTVCTTNC